MSRKPKTQGQPMIRFGEPAVVEATQGKGSELERPSPEVRVVDRGGSGAKPTSTSRRPGRPPIHHEPTRPVSVILRESDEAVIAEIASAIHNGTGASLSMAEVLRACLRGVHASGLDVSAAATERMLTELIAHQIGRGSSPR